jgi:hypothetical protein
MKMRKSFSALVLLVTLIAALLAAFAQSGGTIQGGTAKSGPYTPERGTQERKAIVDALRVPIEKQLKQSVIFKIDHLKVQSGWAFLLAQPQRPDGSSLDYSGTVYQDAIDAGAFDDGVIGLLHNTNGKWRVAQFVIGATDVPYVDWDKKYRAPRAIFKLE